MVEKELMQVDGNMSEGGGQILRIATSLSAIFKIPVCIYDIRGGRKSPGLKAQHLHGIELLRDMTEGHLGGNQLNSQVVEFVPKKLKDGNFKVEVGTAGAVTLLIQSALPCALMSSGCCEFYFSGGTNVDFAPPIDYNIQLLFPILRKFGIKVDCQLVMRGYYPKGGGIFRFQTQPVQQINPVELLQFGEVVKCTGRSYVSGVLPIKIARTMADRAKKLLKEANSTWRFDIEVVKEDPNKSYGNGCGIFLLVETSTGCLLSGSALGRRGLPAQQVAQVAVDQLLQSLTKQACVDEHTQDQLLIFMALANGKSSMRTVELTSHSRTAITLVEQMTTTKFSVEDTKDGCCIVECQGTGHSNQYL